MYTVTLQSSAVQCHGRSVKFVWPGGQDEEVLDAGPGSDERSAGEGWELGLSQLLAPWT